MFSNNATCDTCHHVLKRRFMVNVGGDWFCTEHKPKYDYVEKDGYYRTYYLKVECDYNGRPRFEQRVVSRSEFDELKAQYDGLYNKSIEKIHSLNARIAELEAKNAPQSLSPAAKRKASH